MKYKVLLLLIYLLIAREPTPDTAESAHIKVKERDKTEIKVSRVKKRKGIEAQRVKHPAPFRATDELIRDEEQNG